MTDRFGSTHTGVEDAPCTGLDTYCGGNWAGTAKYLDYIANLNFLAVWTSPITSQTPAGYHGYWYANKMWHACAIHSANNTGQLIGTRSIPHLGMLTICAAWLNKPTRAVSGS